MNPQNGSSPSSSQQHSGASQAQSHQFNMNQPQPQQPQQPQQQQNPTYLNSINRQMGRDSLFAMQQQQQQQQQPIPSQHQHQQPHPQPSPQHQQHQPQQQTQNEESSILNNMAIEHLMPPQQQGNNNQMPQHNFSQRAGPVPHVIQNKPNEQSPQPAESNVKFEEMAPEDVEDGDADSPPQEGSSSSPAPKKRGKRRKIEIKFIDSKAKRRTTFHKRKEGLLKKAYELSTLTGSEALLLIASETGQVYTFATKKFQSLIVESPGKDLIERCLNQPDDNFGE